MVGFAVVVGTVVASHSYIEIATVKSLLGFLCGFFISSFSMVSNDIYDVGVDRVNQPDRPLASGRVSAGAARSLSIFLLLAGLLASALLGPLTLIIALLFALVGWYYNYHGKRLGLFGNSLVALSLAIPYIFGSIAIGVYSINLSYFLAITSFFAGLGREVLKGIADVQGDSVRKIRTVAIRFGVNAAKTLASTMFLLAVATSVLPIVLGLLGNAIGIYLGLVGLTDLIFLYLTLKVFRMKLASDSLKLKSLALGGMLVGLLAYLITGIFI